MTMFKDGVLGTCNSILPRNPETVSTPIRMTASSGHTSTRASRHVLSTIKPPIAVLARTTALPFASQASTAHRQRRFVLTHTALVSSAVLRPSSRLNLYPLAFDDQTSTFIIPSGPGFEVVFCPPGRSSTILRSMASQRIELARFGINQKLLQHSSNETLMARNVGSASASALVSVSASLALVLASVVTVLVNLLQGLL